MVTPDYAAGWAAALELACAMDCVWCKHGAPLVRSGEGWRHGAPVHGETRRCWASHIRRAAEKNTSARDAAGGEKS